MWVHSVDLFIQPMLSTMGAQAWNLSIQVYGEGTGWYKRDMLNKFRSYSCWTEGRYRYITKEYEREEYKSSTQLRPWYMRAEKIEEGFLRGELSIYANFSGWRVPSSGHTLRKEGNCRQRIFPFLISFVIPHGKEFH